MWDKVLIGIGVAAVAVGIIAYVAYRWSQLKDWASNWLSQHPNCRRVICDAQWFAIECAAAIKRGSDKVRVPVAVENRYGNREKVVTEEEISLNCVDEFKKKMADDPVLAVSC